MIAFSFFNIDCPCGRRCELFGGKIGYCQENNSHCKDTDVPPNCSAWRHQMATFSGYEKNHSNNIFKFSSLLKWIVLDNKTIWVWPFSKDYWASLIGPYNYFVRL